MKAIILAAGYATRLYPLTLNTPKALLSVGKKPILNYIVDDINNIEEIDEILIVSNDKFFYDFTSWKDNSHYSKPIKIINDGTRSDEDKLGAIGDIELVIRKEKIHDDVFIIAGDNLYTSSLKEFFQYFRNIKKDSILAKKVKDDNLLKRMGVVTLDGYGMVTNFEEKPKEPKSDIGVFASYIYLKESVPLFEKYIYEGNNPDAPGYFIAWLHKRKEVYAHIIDADCYDIGTMESYKEVQEKFM